MDENSIFAPALKSTKAMKHINLTIIGKVHHVGFRFSAMEAAFRFAIHGFVMNSGHDKVYIEAEGTEANIELYLGWCRKGPLGARVDQLDVEEAPMKNFTGFESRSRAQGNAQ